MFAYICVFSSFSQLKTNAWSGQEALQQSKCYLMQRRRKNFSRSWRKSLYVVKYFLLLTKQHNSCANALICAMFRSLNMQSCKECRTLLKNCWRLVVWVKNYAKIAKKMFQFDYFWFSWIIHNQSFNLQWAPRAENTN